MSPRQHGSHPTHAFAETIGKRFRAARIKHRRVYAYVINGTITACGRYLTLASPIRIETIMRQRPHTPTRLHTGLAQKPGLRDERCELNADTPNMATGLAVIPQSSECAFPIASWETSLPRKSLPGIGRETTGALPRVGRIRVLPLALAAAASRLFAMVLKISPAMVYSRRLSWGLARMQTAATTSNLYKAE